MEDLVYTVAQTAKLLKTNPAYIYDLIKAGHLPALRLGNYKIRKAAIEDFLERYEGCDLRNPYNVVGLPMARDE